MKKILFLIFIFSINNTNAKNFINEINFVRFGNINLEKNIFLGVNYLRTKNGHTFDRTKKSSNGSTSLGMAEGWKEDDYFEDMSFNIFYEINIEDKLLIGPEIKQNVGYSEDTFGYSTTLLLNIGTYLNENIKFLVGFGETRSKPTRDGGNITKNKYDWNFSIEPKIIYSLSDRTSFNFSLRLDRNIKWEEYNVKYDRTTYSFGLMFKL